MVSDLHKIMDGRLHDLARNLVFLNAIGAPRRTNDPPFVGRVDRRVMNGGISEFVDLPELGKCGVNFCTLYRSGGVHLKDALQKIDHRICPQAREQRLAKRRANLRVTHQRIEQRGLDSGEHFNELAESTPIGLIGFAKNKASRSPRHLFDERLGFTSACGGHENAA